MRWLILLLLLTACSSPAQPTAVPPFVRFQDVEPLTVSDVGVFQGRFQNLGPDCAQQVVLTYAAYDSNKVLVQKEALVRDMAPGEAVSFRVCCIRGSRPFTQYAALAVRCTR